MEPMPLAPRLFAERSEAGSHLLREELLLFPRRELATPVELVVMDEVLGVGPLGPAPRGLVDGQPVERDVVEDVVSGEVP